MKRKELQNLYVLTGNYKLENYGYYDDNTLLKLIEKAYQNFDITILLVNKSIFHSYTVIPLIKSDYNIIAIKPYPATLREYNNNIAFLHDRQHIPIDKNKFVAYEYREGINYGHKTIEEVTGHNYIGSVRYSDKRERYRSLKVLFARRMDRDLCLDYKNILSQFNIVPKSTLKDKLKHQITGALIFVRKLLKRRGKHATNKP